MKIVQVNSVYDVGSTGVIAKELNEYALSQGAIVYATYAQRSIVSDKNLIKIGNKVNYKFHALLKKITGKEAHYSNFATKKFIKKLDKIDPDIVHLHNMHANYINYYSLLDYLAKKDISTVITLHDCWTFTGGCFYNSWQNCHDQINGCKNCNFYNKRKRIFTNGNKTLLKKKNAYSKIKNLAVVGVSNWVLNEDNFGVFNGAKIKEVIYNGVDTETFKPTSSNLREKYNLQNKKVILGVSPIWNKNKGIEEVLSLSKKLQEDQIIVLIGKCKEKTLPSNVLALGRTNNREELAMWYSLADVYVCFSKIETFGMTIIEALSCGTPAIVFNSTAMPELIKDGVGFVVEDTDNLNEKIQILVASEKETEKIREYAKRQFSKEIYLKKYFNLYKKLVEEK